MFPKLFTIPYLGLDVNSYGVMILVGFLSALYIAIQRGKSIDIDKELIMDVGVYSMIVGLIGAKLTYFLVDDRTVFDISDGHVSILGATIGAAIPYIIYTFYKRSAGTAQKVFSYQFLALLFVTLLSSLICSRIGFSASELIVEQGFGKGLRSWVQDFGQGFVFYGGALVGVVMGVIIVKSRGESVWKFADLAAPVMMLGLAFGRMGCFLNGCCWGAKCDLPWAVTFPGKEVSTHPTQIYESLAALCLFFILSYIWKRRKRDGVVILMLGILYPVWRFLVEFIRADNDPFWFGSFLTFSQGISIIVFLGSMILFFCQKGGQKGLTENEK